MYRHTRRAALALIVGGGLFLPAPAHAVNDSDVVTCTFSGRSSGMTDMPLIGPGAGSYSFGSAPPFMGVPNQCRHYDVGGQAGLDPDGTDNTGIYSSSVSASGSYASVTCGNGLSNGHATFTLIGDSEISSIGFSYRMTFAGSGGTSTGTMDGQNGGGPVLIGWIPSGGGTACVNSGAADFNIAGVVTLVP